MDGVWKTDNEGQILPWAEEPPALSLQIRSKNKKGMKEERSEETRSRISGLDLETFQDQAAKD